MADVTSTAVGGARIEELKHKLDDPQVASSLETLLDHADLIAILLQGVSDLMARSGAISKTISSYVAELRTVGQETVKENLSEVNFQEVTTSLFALGRTLGEATPAITRLVESDTISPAAIDVVALAARSLVAGYKNAEENDTRVKLTSIPKILGDPDVGRALGFLVEVARSLGVALKNEPIDMSGNGHGTSAGTARPGNSGATNTEGKA